MNGSKEVVELVAHDARPRSATAAWATRRRRSRCSRSRRRRASRASAPTVATTLDKTYPLARSLHVYTLGEPQGGREGLHRLDPVGRRPEDRRGERLRAAVRPTSARSAEAAARGTPIGPAAGTTQRMSPDARPRQPRPSRPRRPAWAVLGETRARGARSASAASARSCSCSAIFFFVFREAAPVLFSDDFIARRVPVQHRVVSDLGQQRALRDLGARRVGTLSVTALAMLHRGAVRPRRGDLRLGVLRPRACKETLKIVDRAAGRDPDRGLGLHRPDGDEPADRRDHRRAGRPQRAQRRHHPRADERADHRLDRRGRAQGRARLLPRGGAGARRDALADSSTACCCRPPATACWPPCCSASAAPSARRWPC